MNTTAQPVEVGRNSNLSAGSRDNVAAWDDFRQSSYKILVVITFAALAFGALLYATLANDSKPGWVLILILAPCCGCLFIIWKFAAHAGLFGRTLLWTELQLIVLAFGLGMYPFNANIPSFVLEWIGLAFLLTAVVSVGSCLWATKRLVMTQRTVRGTSRGPEPSPGNADEVDTVAISSRPFEAICLFILNFTFVGFSLAFSIAFHDQALRNSGGGGTIGLYARAFPRTAEVSTDPAPGPWPDDSAQSASFSFEFPIGRAILDVAPPEEEEDYEDRHWIKMQENGDQISNVRASNTLAMKKLKREVQNRLESGDLRLLVVGRANEQHFIGRDGRPMYEERHAYSSNFELSTARANAVVLEVLRRLERVQPGCHDRLSVVTIPLSNEPAAGEAPRAMAEVTVLASDRGSRARMSDVALKQLRRGLREHNASTSHSRSFELIDYVYFTVYTITTTGYGDIMPVSAFTKFVSAVANLFEVIFLVVFFGILLGFVAGVQVPISNAGG